MLNDEYEQTQHVFGALCKFLRIGTSRIRNRELSTVAGKTRVRFDLVDVSLFIHLFAFFFITI